MSIAATIRQDKIYLTGIAMLLVSIIFFYYPILTSTAPVFEDGTFFFNYGLVIVYLVILLAASRRRSNYRLAHVFLLLILALVSCYALNRDITIFEVSPIWFAALLIVCCLNYTTILFFHRLPTALQYLICFIAGIALLAFLYLAFFLFPAYVLGVLAAPILGLSLHVFVPLLFVIYTIVFIRRAARTNRRTLYVALAGLGFALAFTAQYAIRWRAVTTRINHDLAAAKTAQNDLPTWVTVAEDCSRSSIEEKIMKANLVYTTTSDWNFSFMPRRSFNERRQHDPLVVVASLFSGATNLTEEDRVNILQSRYDSRHQAERRLWSGDDLVTTGVATDIELWPQLHLSYTEENITVTNTAGHDRWVSREEALYTFHLPEGAVVSSLSLWIDGKEQKSLLSTRQKADNAYTTIVEEHRDPSVVHWQEGNTVVVRVFPVTKESRRFKLGITSPLEKVDKKLIYHSIWFDGPSSTDAHCSVRILPMQPLIEPGLPSGFRSDSTGHERYPPSLLPATAAAEAPIRYNGDYDPNWSLSFGDPGIESATFTFNGKQYTTDAYTPVMQPVDIRQAYLDLNSNWTSEEYQSLLSSLTGMRVYAVPPGAGPVLLTAGNKDSIFTACTNRQFSFFPLPCVTDQAHSLLISKSTLNSPNLSDLNGSAFSSQLQEWLAKGGKVRFYNIGDELSPYWKAMKEAGALLAEKGGLYTLQSHLHHNSFPTDTTNITQMLIDPANLLIRRNDKTPDSTPVNATEAFARGPQTPTAPDHLLRLFAYHEVLQQLKGRLPGHYADADLDGNTPQVQIAQEAGIVTPVSSLVVLEKQSDYDQFNIRQSTNSLHNASLHGKGAVPEPGQWAILLSVLALLGYIRLQRSKHQHHSTNGSAPQS